MGSGCPAAPPLAEARQCLNTTTPCYPHSSHLPFWSDSHFDWFCCDRVNAPLHVHAHVLPAFLWVLGRAYPRGSRVTALDASTKCRLWREDEATVTGPDTACRQEWPEGRGIVCMVN
jgi:hypothetical protein